MPPGEDKAAANKVTADKAAEAAAEKAAADKAGTVSAAAGGKGWYALAEDGEDITVIGRDIGLKFDLRKLCAECIVTAMDL